VATVKVPTTWLLTAAGVATLEVSFGTSLPVLAGGGTNLELSLPGRRSLFADAAAVSVRARDASPLSRDAASIIGTARGFLGLPYLWAGTSAYGLDCSGLVYAVYRAHGILLPRDADNQAMAGRAVARAALQPGDLVFFATNGYVHHVAIYTGNGQILDSPRTGGAVEVIPLATYSDYAGARRILP
jgi:cell wall-associated NlpC family hydrolase